MRKWFFLVGISLVLLAAAGYYFDYTPVWVPVLFLTLFLIGLRDAFQPSHTILRNFPLLGHFRYAFEAISPEIQQYFIERNTDGKPFSRNQRSLVYRRAKDVMDTQPFGTMLDINERNYQGLEHSIYLNEKIPEAPRLKIGTAACKQPYEASLLNISAMSYGALSSRAITALNRGAAKGDFYHNTGEGGISDYHRQGGDLVWQIGTGYFGCRTQKGRFDPDAFAEKAGWNEVKMIELKISQGAKPGHGGVLPGVKNTPEIAKIRNVKPRTTVLSPPGHREFNDAKGLLNFIQKLRDLSGGKPIGIKLCIGRPKEFDEVCQQMTETGIKPDFITVDGAEGGTGAAPPEFSDSVGYPLQPALIIVNKNLLKYGLREEIQVIASGKVLSAASYLKTLALGADLCNSARGFMFSLGCIQALRCNTNQCPTGVATTKTGLMRGLHTTEKSERVYHFHKNTVEAVMELITASGASHPEEVTKSCFVEGDYLGELEDEYFEKDELTPNKAIK